jgi:hypothetical protein
MTGAHANPAREASRISIASFSVVTLGYSRSEVNRYLSGLRETLERRAERRPAAAIAVADEPGVEAFEAAAPEEPAELAEPEVLELELEEPQAEIEEPAADAEPDEPAEPVETDVFEEPSDIVSAAANGSASATYAARVTEAVSGDAGSPAVAPDHERAALFATALDLRIEGAVAMTRDELRVAIDDAQGVEGEEPVLETPQDTVAESGDDVRQAVMAALHQIRAAVEALESLVARDMPAEQAVEEPVIEPDPEPAPPIVAAGNGHAQMPSMSSARPEPIRYGPVGYSAEPRPGLLNLTRDIIRLARGGMVTRR